MAEQIENKLRWINIGNETGLIQLLTLGNLLEKFPNEELIGLEIGCAYGGGVEAGAKLWKGRGKFYGYDTFEGHPVDLAANPEDLEATCMEMWYNDENFGTWRLDHKYQTTKLYEQGLDNAFLVKGRINEHSFDDIEKVHFAIIDLDLIKPTKIAYEAIKDKIVVGGYLFMHDALPKDHLPMIHSYVYHQIIPEGRWKIMYESPKGNLTAMERWTNVFGNLNGQLLDISNN